MAARGRRSGNPETREEVLQAARAVFGEHGYAAATIRSIASKAGVDPALVHHYFGTKNDLFAASISLPFTPVAAIGTALEGDRSGAGRRLAELFFAAWEADKPRAALLALLRAALEGNEQAAQSLREFVVDGLRDRLAAIVDADDAELRAAAVAGHLLGCAVMRYAVRVEPLASAEVSDVIDLVAPRLQSYID